MAKPKYITDLEETVEKLKTSSKELKDNQDNMMVTQGQILTNQKETSDTINTFGGQIKEIHTFLMGSEYEKEMNGGFAKKVALLRLDVAALKRWKDRIMVTTTIAYTLLTGALGFLAAVVVKNWDKIFPSP